MAEDTVDKAIEVGNLKPTNKCKTANLVLLGGEYWDKALFTAIAQNFTRSVGPNEHLRIPSDIAKHLSHAYGTRLEF